MPLADVAGHKLYYEIHPAREPVEDLPPVVLVMGTGGRCAGWLPFQVPALSAHRDVVIYDHRGVGECGFQPYPGGLRRCVRPAEPR